MNYVLVIIFVGASILFAFLFIFFRNPYSNNRYDHDLDAISSDTTETITDVSDF